MFKGCLRVNLFILTQSYIPVQTSKFIVYLQKVYGTKIVKKCSKIIF